MKIHVTLWYKDFRRSSLVREVAEGGFDGFELSLDYPLCGGPAKLEELAQIRDLLGLGLGAAVHLPWREIYLASPVEEIRRVSLDYTVRCLEDVGRLEPAYAVLHLTADQAVCFDSVERCVSAAAESLGVLARVAEETGTQLYVETTRNYCCGGLEQSVSYLELGARLCLDVPHAIERHSRLRKTPLGLSDVLLEAPPRAIEAVECVHLHGYSMSGYHVVESHLEPDRELLSEYLKALRRGALKPRYTVLEAFYSATGRRQLRFDELRWCVDELKKARPGDR